ncbi:MAG: carboxypeptidase regulatory-like domain-containing protein [Candidatus Muirbacterium halophilum]|nr:carboxypeptidase regulatory-like domain-containing protein [Candidatus Muirbacterium halophilum]MCK9476936.1 carboxypeptidase regulatory-like domain-containing protein [Candidatus Muirbacterium halophilum]
MKQNFYIIAVLITLFIILGCQTGSNSFPSSIYIPSSSVNITGQITDNTGTPISGVKIVIIPSAKTVYSDILGKYSIPVSIDSQKITFLKKDYLSEESLFSQGITVYNKILIKGASSFTGTLYEKDTTIPITSANIEISSKTNSLNVYTTTSDINGLFVFNSIPSEEYNIKISCDNFSILTEDLTSTQINSGSHTFYLSPSSVNEYTVTGNIMQSGTNNPVSGATVELYTLNDLLFQNQKKLTDSSGKYLFQNIPTGFFKLIISKNNFTTYQKIISVDENEIVEDINISITTGSTPSGTGTKEIVFVIKDADTGLNIPGVIIEFKDSHFNSITNNNGSSTFIVPIAQYNIDFVKDGYKTQSRTMNMADVIVNPVNIIMVYDLVNNLGNIKGEVTRSDTLPFVGEVAVKATLHTLDEIGQNISIITVADQITGKYIFRNLQILYNPDGKEYKYILEAGYDFNGSGTIDTEEISYQIVDLEAGKTSIADIMLIAP